MEFGDIKTGTYLTLEEEFMRRTQVRPGEQRATLGMVAISVWGKDVYMLIWVT